MPITFTWGKLIITGSGLIIVVVTATWAMLKYYTKKRFDQHFAEKLESHKSELNKIIDLNKFELQRKMHDFSLYTGKVHEVYQKMYELICIAEGNTAQSASAGSYEPNYLYMNEEQLEHFLKETYQLHEVTYKEYVNHWNENKDKKIDDLKSFVNRVKTNRTDKSIDEAISYFLLSKLYLSQDVDQLIDSLITDITKCMINVKIYKDPNYSPGSRMTQIENIEKYSKSCREKLNKLREQMQTELKKGYY
jgi:hypothetical protein